MKPGSFCHIEFPSAQSSKAKKFFSDLFGWKFTAMPGMEYETFETPGGGMGGGMWNPPTGMPRFIVNYILVDSVDAHSKKIESAGGKILKTKTEVPGMGWFAVFQDVDQNPWGIWETNPEFVDANMTKMEEQWGQEFAAGAATKRGSTQKKALKSAGAAKKAKPVNKPMKAGAKKAATKAATKSAAKSAKGKPAAKAAKPAAKGKQAVKAAKPTAKAAKPAAKGKPAKAAKSTPAKSKPAKKGRR